MVVVGGFVDKSFADAAALVQEVMVGLKGYKDVNMIDVERPLALARCDSPGQAMKFIRSQKQHATVQTNQLWASENRSRTERSRCKIVSTTKKYLMELGGIAPVNVIASHKNFRLVVRHKPEWIPVGKVGMTLEVKWLGYSIVNVPLRAAMEAFMQDLEYGCLSTLLNKRKVVRVTGDATNDAVYVPWGRLHRKNYLQSIRAESRFEDFLKRWWLQQGLGQTSSRIIVGGRRSQRWHRRLATW